MINDAISTDGPEFDGYYVTARTSLLALVDTAPAAVLEIGCGGGANLAELRRRYPACRTVGVEVHAEAARQAVDAGRADRIVIGDVLDNQVVDFPPAEFDLIVMSHVLEHFAEPGRVLERAVRWLRPGGFLLIALPNVRHVSVLIDLVLRGDFPYAPAGILDQTHLRFYTRRSASRFLAQNGLQVEAIVADVDGTKSTWLDRLTLGVARDFAAFAYNIRARPS